MSHALSTDSARPWKRPLVALGILAALVGALLAPMSASAAVPTVSGVLSNASGVKLAGATVSLIDYSTNVTQATTVTSAAGLFSFSGMPFNDYVLFFPKTTTTYAQYLGGETSPDLAFRVEVNSATSTKVELNAVARLGSTIKGTITNASAIGVANFTVRAYQIDPQGDWNVAATTTTNASGVYYLRGLKPGAYRLETLDLAHSVPAYAPLYSGSAVSLAAGTDIGVVGGATATYNFRLGTSGKISGVVSGVVGAEKLAGVKVNVHQLVGTPGSFSESVSLASPSVTTGATGAYTISGLAAGYYTLEFVAPLTPVAPSVTQYGREFLGNQAQAIDATYVKVANGTVATGKNIQLTAGFTLHGEVLEDEDLPTQTVIDDIQVTVDHATADPAHPSKDAQTMFTNAALGDNSFSFSGLGAGDWVLIIGSLTDGDTSRGRHVVPLSNGPLNSDPDNDVNTPPVYNRLERVSVPLVDPQGMHPTSGNEPVVVPFAGYSVGQTLSTDVGIWSSPVDWTDFTYQWYRNGHPIPGATSQSYDLTAGDWSSVVGVIVSVCNFTVGCGSYTTAPSPTIDIGTISPNTPPSISGTLQVGKTITASPGTWSIGGGTYDYNWQVSPDSTNWTTSELGGPTHVITAFDLASGPYIRAHITGSRYGFSTYFGDALGYDPIVAGTFTPVTPPAVTMTATNFVVSGGTWSPTGGTTSALWTVHNNDGSTSQTAGSTLPRAGLAGKYVSVQVNVSKAGYTTYTTAPKTVQVGTHPMPVESKLITGTAQVSSTLSAPAFTWTPTETTLTWKWQYFTGTTWANVAGATASSFVVPANMLNRYLRVVTTESTTGYGTITIVSPQTAKVIAGVPLVNSTPASVDDLSPETGQTITANAGVWTPSATVTYQWKRIPVGGAAYTTITGATSASYKIPVTLLHTTLAVDVKATRAGHPTTVVTVVLTGGTVQEGFIDLVTKPVATRVGTSNVWTVSPGTWSSAIIPGDTSYQFFTYDSDDANPTPASGGSGNTFDSSCCTLFSHVAFTVTVHAAGYAYTTSPLMLLKYGTIEMSSPPTLDDNVVGSVFTPNLGSYQNSGVTSTYQWQYLAGATWTNIAGATALHFTPSGAYLNKQIKLRITAKALDYNTAIFETNGALVGVASSANPGVGGLAPTVTGAPSIGSTLTAVSGTWSLPGLAFTYQWRSSISGGGFNPIVGATAATYKVPEAMLGSDIDVLITAKKIGYANGYAIVDPTPGTLIGIGTLTTTVKPVVTKSLTGVLSVTKGSWNVAPTAYSYEWKRYDQATDTATTVAGPSASATSYKPVVGDGTKLITVTVTATRANYSNGVSTVVARKGPALAATTAPFVFGSNVVGSQLVSLAPDWNSPSPTLSYHWYRDGILIAGQTAAAYTQVVADIGHVVSVTVTGSKFGYTSMSYNLKSPKTLSAVPLTATTKPSITGTAATDSVLTAKVGVWSVASLTYTYQWTTDGVAIPGATAATYKVAPEDVYNEIAVVVTAHRTNYVNGVATSASVTPLYGDAPVPLSTPIIASTASNGVQLKASNVVTWNLKVNLSYTWQVQPSGTFGFGDITGANSPTFTPIGYASGDTFRLVITAIVPGHYGANSVSNDSVYN